MTAAGEECLPPIPILYFVLTILDSSVTTFPICHGQDNRMDREIMSYVHQKLYRVVECDINTGLANKVLRLIVGGSLEK